jgi:hypothetical protein
MELGEPRHYLYDTPGREVLPKILPPHRRN